jgi:hypothetical protein
MAPVSPRMAENIRMSWAQVMSPEDRMAELKARLANACDEFVAAELGGLRCVSVRPQHQDNRGRSSTEHRPER